MYDIANYGFHARQGLFFQRDNEGNVIVRKVTGRMVMFKVTLDPDSWASVVASVCPQGDNADTFQRAKNFHDFGRHEPPTAI